VLIYCRAGCSQAEVIAALQARGLWPSGIAPRRLRAGYAQCDPKLREREVRKRQLRELHAKVCTLHRLALDNQRLVLALLRRDPNGADPGVAVALKELGDPWLHEQVIAGQLDDLDGEMRALGRTS
jgi:hypothetical protein